jgi:hypothetical protein
VGRGELYKTVRTVHIQLGRNGDLILLLPCWRKIYQDSGQRPIVIVAREFSGVLNGANYVEADIINRSWYQGMPEAKKLAKFKYGEFTVTQCHGLEHGCDMSQWSTFGETMWARAGFPGQYGKLPMVFDRRNPGREADLLRKYPQTKPLLLFNFSGNSSPLPCAPDLRHRVRRFERLFTCVNLASFKAKYIYDLLGLYDAAAGLITIDTSTLHLAAASPVATLAYLRGGWNSAIAKPGAVTIPYEQAHARLDDLDRFVQSLAERRNEHLSLLHKIRSQGPRDDPTQLHSPKHVEAAALGGDPDPR